jgi:hypothetical protein
MSGKKPLDRADLKALTAACRDPNPTSRWDRLQKTLDVDRFLSFMAVETILCDWDGYVAAQHNYRVYQDLDTGGRIVFMPHDKDQILGNPGNPIIPGTGSLVSQTILNTPQARQMYRERFIQIFTNVFKPAELNAQIDWVVAKLKPGLEAWDRNYVPSFVNNANGLKARVSARARGLEAQFRPPPPKPVIAAAPSPKPNPPPAPKPAVAAAPNSPPHKLVPDPIKAQWEPVQAQNASKLAKLQMDNKPVLYMKCEQPNSICAWRANLDLPPGTYRFSGRAKTRGLAAQSTKYGAGGGLRISGCNRKNTLEGDKDWTTLQEEFNVQAPSPVRVFCELRANKGEIWFDLASLKLERVK